MATSLKIITTVVVIFVISNIDLTKAESDPENDDRTFPGFPGFGGFKPPNFTDLFGGGSGFPNFGSTFGSSGSEGSGNEEGESRLFFASLLGGAGQQRVSCDYNTQAGFSCRSCNELLFCGRNGGRLKTCRGFLRYCTDGRCTFRQSDACAAAAEATTTEADSTTTTQATDTTTVG